MTPSGSCECGCGQQTRFAPQTNRAKGWVRGEPLRFVLGHQSRRSPVDYIEQDCGYETPCWVWQHSLNEWGYGECRRGNHNLAHRFIYEEHIGPVPEGLVLDHLCRNPPCVNPVHMEPVTQAENCRRGAKARLTPASVAAIRESSLPVAELAAALGVGRRTVSAARAGETWGEVAA